MWKDPFPWQPLCGGHKEEDSCNFKGFTQAQKIHLICKDDSLTKSNLKNSAFTLLQTIYKSYLNRISRRRHYYMQMHLCITKRLWWLTGLSINLFSPYTRHFDAFWMSSFNLVCSAHIGAICFIWNEPESPILLHLIYHRGDSSSQMAVCVLQQKLSVSWRAQAKCCPFFKMTRMTFVACMVKEIEIQMVE